MNEQMIELYKQAQEFAYKNISKESWNTDNFHAVVSGKFSELIVREVMRMCGSASVSLLEHGYPTEASTMTTVKEFIADHFGVEG